MPNSSHEIRDVSTVSWGGSIFGILSGLALFLPGAPQTFMMENPLVGWLGFALVLAAHGPLAQWYLKRAQAGQSRLWGKKVTELSNHWIREEARLAAQFMKKESELFRINSEKDMFLLNERLENMNMNGKFHTYLAEGVDHKNLDFSFISQLEEHTTKWHRDWREFFDPEITKVWQNFTAAAEAYGYKVLEYTWTKEESDRLHVPPEWKDTDHKRYQIAFKELDASRTALYVALNELHRVQHARGITAPPQASKALAVPAGMARNNLVDPPPVPKQI
ncbi:hypothetical protein [Arthrobacter sp. UYCu723]